MSILQIREKKTKKKQNAIHAKAETKGREGSGVCGDDYGGESRKSEVASMIFEADKTNRQTHTHIHTKL
jgi:hypothetical protein